MEQNHFSLGGKLYRIKNEKLFDITFGRTEVNQDEYYYLVRLGRPNILFFQEKAYWHSGTDYKAQTVLPFAESAHMNYFYISANALEDRCAFYRTVDGKIGFMGRSFEEVVENELYKIGKQLYQKQSNGLTFLQKCESYEFWRDRLEVHTGEEDYSELFVYKKVYGAWTEVYNERPGVIKPKKTSV